MLKRVKGKIQKYYCDVCGKNVFDYVPNGAFMNVLGMRIPVYDVRKHCEYVQKSCLGKSSEYCKECYEKLNKSTK